MLQRVENALRCEGLLPDACAEGLEGVVHSQPDSPHRTDQACFTNPLRAQSCRAFKGSGSVSAVGSR